MKYRLFFILSALLFASVAVAAKPVDVELMGKEVLKLAAAKMAGEEKEERAKALGRAIRTVGGSQDSMVAHFRHVGKCVRRIALSEYMAAKSPAAAEFWGEVYRHTEALLQGYYCDGK